MARTKVLLSRKYVAVIERRLFDACIDCLYEYDLGEELPRHWPRRVRRAIEAARDRIVKRRWPSSRRNRL